MTSPLNKARLGRAAAVGLSLALAGTLAACGGSSDSTAPQDTASGHNLASQNPLTGLPMSNSAQTHPPYIVKIDNTAASQPQIGIGSADLVTEELVEGGITRLAVFFYDKLPTKVGPVRSMRLTDIGIAKPIDAAIVTSGGAPVTLNGVRSAKITFFDMNNSFVTRNPDGSHDFLHSVMANLHGLGGAAKQQAARPNDYLPWGTEALPAGKPATSIAVKLSSARTSNWKYVAGHYLLEDSYMAMGDSFNPDTVITATVRTSTASYRDPAGSPVPISHFVGSGKAIIFHGGTAVKATWVKEQEGSAITFKDATGKELDIPAGRVWLELVPGKGTFPSGSVSFRK